MIIKCTFTTNPRPLSSIIPLHYFCNYSYTITNSPSLFLVTLLSFISITHILIIAKYIIAYILRTTKDFTFTFSFSNPLPFIIYVLLDEFLNVSFKVDTLVTNYLNFTSESPYLFYIFERLFFSIQNSVESFSFNFKTFSIVFCSVLACMTSEKD